MFTVKLELGVLATSYSGGDKFFIDPFKLLPLERFLPQPKGMQAHPDLTSASGAPGARNRFGEGHLLPIPKTAISVHLCALSVACEYSTCTVRSATFRCFSP
jgi:hypothetical protein